jgi:hypothetical protein
LLSASGSVNLYWRYNEEITMYQVIGDENHKEPLFESTECNECIRWAKNYIRWGDFGGYREVSVWDDADYMHWHAINEMA